MVVTLIGYRGCGKSTVAAPLAARLGWSWCDADDEIERRAGKSIREIFADEGEPHFRELESRILAELLAKDRLVVAAGGGAVLDVDTRVRMRAAGPVVWLQAGVDLLETRIQTDRATAERRPNLTTLGGRAEIEKLLAQREPLYRECANYTVATDDLAVEEVVDRVFSAIEPTVREKGLPVTAYGVPLSWILPYLFVMGAVIGSWLNVCIYRIPRHDRLLDQLRGIVSPPSSCPGCGQRIRWYDNVPIVGWLKLGGRCRVCRMRISPRYPIIEFLNGLIFVVLYWYEIPDGWSATLKDAPFFPLPGFEQLTLSQNSASILLHARYAYHLVLIEALLVASLIDFDLKIIPDGSTLPAMAVGVLGAFLGGYLFLVPLWWKDPSIMQQIQWLLPESWHVPFSASRYPEWIVQWPHLHGLLVSLAGLVVGGGVVWGVRLIGRWVLREEAMGFGDVVLMAMIGSFLGWQPTLIVFFIAPVCALAVVAVSWLFRRQREVPYGPYLSLATVIVLFGWGRIWPACSRIFDLGPLLPLFAAFSAVLLAGSLLTLQGIKRALGISTRREEWIEEWTPADQLLQFASNKIDDPNQLRQKTTQREWAGIAAARGTLYQQRWRDGTTRR